tara:strand:- start:11085 stop:13574 length:2490 start_codon:yes stop_codon:yes gene_type:complete
MIDRRYPIQTVLANRKMFAGGGVVSPQQTAAPVQPSMGILSSSVPLMEAVAADAVNPAGGSTMVEAAEFSNGGAVQIPKWNPSGPSTQYFTMPNGDVVEIPKPAQVTQSRAGAVEPIEDITGSEGLISQIVSGLTPRGMDPRSGERTRIGPGADPEALKRRAGSYNTASEVFPDEAKLTGGVLDSKTATSGPWWAPGSGQRMQGPGSLLEDAAKVPYNVADSILREAGQLTGRARDTFVDLWNTVSIQHPDEVGNLKFAEQQFAIGEALRRRPTVSGVSDQEILDRISDTSKKALQADPQVSGEVLSEVLSKDLIETYETPYRQATEGFGGRVASGEPPDTSGEDITSAEIEAMDLDKPGLLGLAADFSDVVTGKSAEKILKEQNAVVEGAQETVGSTSDSGPSDDAFDRAEIDAEDASDAPGSGQRSIEALLAAGFDDVVKEAETPDETKKGMSDYFKRFKDAMGSEYKGMSDSEKGYAIMEAGLKIMAGQSPYALVNIAEGLKGLGPQFAKDAKEKRMWDRQVNLSAAKYALAAVDKDTERLRAFAEKERDLISVMNPKTGDLKTVTKADLRAGNIPKGYLPTSDPFKNWISGVKATKQLIEAQAKLAGEGQITSKWLKVGDDYASNAQKVLDSVQSKTLLGPAVEILFRENQPVTGIRGVIGQSWNRFSNAFGFTDNKSILKKEGEDKEKYISRVQAVIAKKITAILGESNRTISTPDRTRADQIAGVFADYLWAPMGADVDILRDKVTVLWQTLENDERQGLARMKFAEDSVGTLTVPGGGRFFRDVLREQRKSILRKWDPSASPGRVRKLSDFGYNIEKGTWSK